MPHQRQVIREAVRAALDNATAAADRVVSTRVLPLRKQELPAIAVYTLEESVAIDETVFVGARELTRVMPVVVEGWVKETTGTNVDDAMDALAEEIEAVMHADPYWGGEASDSMLADTVLEVVEVGDRLLGMVALTYQFTYHTFAPVPITDAAADDFQTVEAVHNLGNDVDPGDEASDLFTVEAP